MKGDSVSFPNTSRQFYTLTLHDKSMRGTYRESSGSKREFLTDSVMQIEDSHYSSVMQGMQQLQREQSHIDESIVELEQINSLLDGQINNIKQMSCSSHHISRAVTELQEGVSTQLRLFQGKFKFFRISSKQKYSPLKIGIQLKQIFPHLLANIQSIYRKPMKSQIRIKTMQYQILHLNFKQRERNFKMRIYLLEYLQMKT